MEWNEHCKTKMYVSREIQDYRLNDEDDEMLECN